MKAEDMKSYTCNRCLLTKPSLEMMGQDRKDTALFAPDGWLGNVLREFGGIQTVDLCANCKAELLLWIEKGKGVTHGPRNSQK